MVYKRVLTILSKPLGEESQKKGDKRYPKARYYQESCKMIIYMRMLTTFSKLTTRKRVKNTTSDNLEPGIIKSPAKNDINVNTYSNRKAHDRKQSQKQNKWYFRARHYQEPRKEWYGCEYLLWSQSSRQTEQSQKHILERGIIKSSAKKGVDAITYNSFNALDPTLQCQMKQERRCKENKK